MLAETFLKNHLPKILFSPNSEGRQVFCETRCFVKSTYTQKNLHKKLFFFWNTEYRKQLIRGKLFLLPLNCENWRAYTLCWLCTFFCSQWGTQDNKKGPFLKIWYYVSVGDTQEIKGAGELTGQAESCLSLSPGTLCFNHTAAKQSDRELHMPLVFLPLSPSLSPLRVSLLHFFSSFLHIPKNSRLISCSLPTSSHMLHHFMDLR